MQQHAYDCIQGLFPSLNEDEQLARAIPFVSDVLRRLLPLFQVSVLLLLSLEALQQELTMLARNMAATGYSSVSPPLTLRLP